MSTLSYVGVDIPLPTGHMSKRKRERTSGPRLREQTPNYQRVTRLNEWEPAGSWVAHTRPYLEVVFEHRLYRRGSAAGLTGTDGYSRWPVQHLARLGTPWFAVDGCDFQGDWNYDTTVNIAPGDHHVDVYLRYDHNDEKSPYEVSTYKRGSADFFASEDSIHRLHVFFARIHTTTTYFTEDRRATIRRRRWFAV
jgi:hypothetical protein